MSAPCSQFGVPLAAVADWVEVQDSVREVHVLARATSDGIVCAVHVVWWVTHLAVAVLLIVLIAVVLVGVIVNAILKLRDEDVRRKIGAFATNWSNVLFVSLGDGVCVNTRGVVFDGEIRR